MKDTLEVLSYRFETVDESNKEEQAEKNTSLHINTIPQISVQHTLKNKGSMLASIVLGRSFNIHGTFILH